jgi:hypothetical protein
MVRRLPERKAAMIHSSARDADDMRPIARRGAVCTHPTRHAHQRQARRSIPDLVVDGLLAFGRSARTPDGQARRWRFGRRGWARFALWLGPDAPAFERYRRVIVITKRYDVVRTAAREWH